VCDYLVAYGQYPPRPITPEIEFGLVLNVQRAEDRRVYRAGLAHSLAAGRGEVPLHVVAAACSTAAQAEDLAFEINAARAQAEAGF
jgi:hypothetical protein